MSELLKCPNCHSPRVGHMRLDGDWASHAGDWSPANTVGVLDPDPAIYTEEDVEDFDQGNRPGIDCFICCICNTHFEPPTEPDEAMVERVATTLALYGVWPDEAKKVARAAIRAMEER